MIRNGALGILFIILLVFSGCSERTKTISKEVDELKITYVEEVNSDDEKYVASLAVEGMACEMMCGGLISGALAKLEGVKETEIDFNGVEEDNFVLVEFDANSVSEKEMVSAIETLADGHYDVNAVKVTHFRPASSAQQEKKEKVSSYDTRLKIEMPNIFGVFSRLF